jgi:uncharacterized tellurite resistance protein B-like protein
MFLVFMSHCLCVLVCGSGDGNVDMKEFHAALALMHIQIPKKEIKAVVNFLDKNGDEMIQVGALVTIGMPHRVLRSIGVCSTESLAGHH